MLRTATTLLLLLAMPASAGGFKVALGEMAEGEKAQWAPNGARENTECGSTGVATPRRASGKAGVGYETAAGPAEDLTHDITGVFNRADWLTAQTDARDASRNVQLAYDVNGNVTQKTTAASARSYRWDARDTLTAVLDNGVAVGRYDYDRNLQRVKRTAGAERVEYVLDDKYVLQEADGSQSSHPATRRYHYAAQPLAVTTGAVTSYLNVDALGSVTDATSTAGAVTTARQYDAWGQYRNNTAPTPTEPKLGFTGHQFDVETGLVYARARYYDPALGIFLSRDSVEGNLNDAPSLHRYTYVHNNPLRYTDPDGHAVNLVAGGIGALIGFGVGFGAALLDDAPLSEAFVAGGIGAGIGGVAGLTLGASLVVEGATTLGVVTLTATKVAVGTSLDVARQKLAIDSGRQEKFSYRELAAAVGVSVAVPVGGEVAQAPNIALVAKSAGVVLGTAGVAVTGPEAVTAAIHGEGQQAMSAGFDTLLGGLGIAGGGSLAKPAPARTMSIGSLGDPLKPFFDSLPLVGARGPLNRVGAAPGMRTVTSPEILGDLGLLPNEVNIYAINEAGKLIVAPRGSAGPSGSKHTELLAGGRARAAGELRLTPSGTVEVNSQSGRYLRQSSGAGSAVADALRSWGLDIASTKDPL